MNKAMIKGYVGQDPDLRSTQSGQQVANFSMATNRRWNDREGNRQEQTEWHNVVAWGKQAETLAQYVFKGSELLVIGRLQTRSWEDRDSGQKRYKTEIVMEEFHFCGPKKDGGQRRDTGREYNQGGSGHGGAGAEDDDIPF